VLYTCQLQIYPFIVVGAFLPIRARKEGEIVRTRNPIQPDFDTAFIILDAQPPPLYHPHPRPSPSTSISQGENVKKGRKTKRSKKEKLQMEKTSRQGIRN